MSLRIHLYYNSVRVSVFVSVCPFAYSSETNERVFTKFVHFFFLSFVAISQKNDVTRCLFQVSLKCTHYERFLIFTIIF